MDKVYKFDSGLTLLYTKNNVSKSTAVNIQFDCGAREDGELHGLSHFCEHCFFTGTDKLTQQQVLKRYFDFICSNARTSFEDIKFVAEVTTSKFESYLSTVADMICNSTFTKTAIEQEKKVVLQEIVRSLDNNSQKATLFREYCVTGLPEYKFGVLGDAESVSKITNKDVKKYVKKYFVKNNCYVYVCSPLSFGQVKKLVKQQFERVLPVNPKLKPLPYDNQPIVMDNFVNVKSVNINKNYFYYMLKWDESGTSLKYRTILGVIIHLITDFSDGLTKMLRVDRGLVYNLDAEYCVNADSKQGYIIASSQISTENINKCIDAISDYINTIAETGFSAEQFNRELEKNEYYWQTRIDNPSSMANRLKRYRMYGKFATEKEFYQMVRNLTLDEVNEVAKQVFCNSNISVIVYGDATRKDVYTIKQVQKKLKR